MTSLLNLKDKVILVTGATGGIGRATAVLCDQLQATLYLCGRDQDGLEQLQSQLKGNHHTLCYDVTNTEQVKQNVTQVMKQSGKLDGLVNNAGVMIDAPLAMTRIEDLEQQWRVNSQGALLHAQFASRLMGRQTTSSMVNLCSIVGEKGSSGQVAYSMTKAAVTGMTLSLSKELASLGIRVNGVAPGFIETDMTAQYSAQTRDNLIKHIGLGRLGRAEDVAATIAFLLSDSASYITGQIIGIDGGFIL